MSKRTTILNSLLLILLSIAIAAPAQKKKIKKKEKKKSEQISSSHASTQPVVLGIVQSSAISEASGIAASKALPDYYWTHNDSGNGPEVFLLNNKGQLISTLHLEGVSNRDWEDIAEGIGPVPHKQYVYVGDIGNNIHLDRRIRILRFPSPIQVPAHNISIKPDVLHISLTGGLRDAETLMVDPIGRFLYIISKREKAVGIYKANLDFKDGDKAIFQKVGTVPYTWITAGDISQDGKHIMIKNKEHIYYWHRNAGETVEAAMARPAIELPYLPEKQGEGVTFSVDNSGYITISEGKKPALNFYPHKF